MDKQLTQKIIEGADIVDVVGQFVDLKKKGARYIGLCPFHDDRHATNFSVYPKKRCYKCFACDAKGDAVKFLMDYGKMDFADAVRWLAKRQGINIDDRAAAVEIKSRPTPPPLPTLFLPSDMVDARRDNASTLCGWLQSLPWTSAQAARVDDVLEAYKIGRSRWGDVIFWQIDESGGVRDGKIMKYKSDGHRDKDSRFSVTWVTPRLFKAGYYDEAKWEVRHCLFGLHLLDKYKGAEVHIVESEKTALFCAIYFGEPDKHIWMATAGKSNLTRELLAPLIAERRTIAVHPDRDAIDDWAQRLKEIGYQRAYVNDAVMVLQWKPEDGEKADMADVLSRQLTERRMGKTMRVGEIMKIVPGIKTLIDKNDGRER